jgi:predicted CXXCH cytochrome family protein
MVWEMNRKLIFFLVSIAYLVLIAYGLHQVYTVEATLRVKEVPAVKPENKIAIARTEIFGKLERPQVIFDHAKHEEAYKKEGCTACHPERDGQIIFDFPMNLKKRDKTSVMNAYHDECMGCHKKVSAKKEKSGPVNCGDCHKEQEKDLVVEYPKAEFDFYVHDKHVKKLKEKLGKDDCGQCHHTYSFEEKKLIYKEKTEESCYYCHDLDKKRGPELAALTKVAAEKGLSMRRASHQQCLNCHLEYAKKAKKDEKVGPIECIKCHTGEYKTVAELEKIPRPDRGQKERIYINIENARLKGVSFNHQSHEKYSRTCRDCHHETLKACKECHSLAGKPEGNGVNIASAYHDMFSEHSCTGCHNVQKARKECAGCHNFIAAMDVETMSPKQKSCGLCHTGKDPLPMPSALSTAGISREEIKEVTVKVLENEYEPAKFPHLDIVNKLAKISNDSKLATYFHRNIQTICAGCHHRSPSAAEVQKDSPPYCRNCHMIAYDKKNLNSIRLLTAYHNQCVGCHDAMKLEKGSSLSFAEGDRCEACHRKKDDGPAEITKLKNENVVRQNTKNILNVWRPK